MDIPVQPTPPVNPIVSIQPVVGAVSHNPTGQAANPLASLVPGTLVEGFVLNRDATGTPIVRTNIGDVKVTSEVFLKTGSEIVFRVDTTQAGLARIITVDGLTPGAYTAQHAHAALSEDTITTSGLQSLLAAMPTAVVATKPGAALPPPLVLQAIVLQPSPQAAAGATATPSFSLPSPPTAQAHPHAPPIHAQTQSLMASFNPSALQLARLKSGTPLRLTLLDVKLPPLPVALAALPAGNRLEALIPAPAGALRLTATASLPTLPSASPLPTAGATATAATTPAAPSALTALPNPAPAAAVVATLANPLPSAAFALADGSAAAPQSSPTSASSPPPAPLTPGILAPLQHALRQHEQLREVATLVRTAQRLYTAEQPLPNPPAPKHLAAPALLTPTPLAVTTAPSSPTLPLPAPEAAPLTPATARGVLISASVIGHDAEGANILHTSGASLKLYTRQPLPTGTTLVMEASAESLAMAAPLEEGLTLLPPPPTADALEETLRWLGATQPDLARELRERLPATNAKLSSDLLYMLAAVKSGDVSALLGPRAARTLELQAPALAMRLRAQLAATAEALGGATVQPGWAHLLMPFLHGQEMQHLTLYIHRDPPPPPDEPGARGTGQRFVLEVKLSAIGALQLDGFVRTREHAKSFDLMVRSEKPLEPDISQGIRSIFTEALAATRLNGQVLFQVGGQHFFRLPAPPGPASDGGESMQPILA